MVIIMTSNVGFEKNNIGFNKNNDNINILKLEKNVQITLDEDMNVPDTRPDE